MVRLQKQIDSVFKIGMPSDAVLQIARETGRVFRDAPLEVGKDENGDIVKWFLEVDLTFRRYKVNKINCYRVTKIEAPKTNFSLKKERSAKRKDDPVYVSNNKKWDLVDV